MPHVQPTCSEALAEGTHCAATSSPIRQMGGNDFTALAVSEIETSELARTLECPSRISDDPQATLIKRGRSALVVRVDLPSNGAERPVAYKRCGSRTFLRRFVRGVRTAAAVRNFRLGHKLLALGIATPRPVLAIAPRWHNLLSPSFLATEWVEGGLPLDTFVRVSIAGTRAHRREQLCDAARRLGRLIGTLHVNGFSHRDLKAANLLVRENGCGVDVFLIDLDGATVPHLRIATTRLKNLARLQTATCRMSGVTATLRCRFLQAYLATLGNSADWKTVWRQLRKASRIPPLRTG